MHTRSRIIVAAVTAATVVGVGFAAAPAVARISDIMGVRAASTTDLRPSHTPSAAAPESPSPSPSSPDVAGLPSGYENLGPVSIPAAGPDGCTAMSYINIMSTNNGPFHATLLGPDLVDNGPREYARGTAGLNAQGQIASYTVAPGDALGAIGDRFCIYNGLSIGTLNGLSANTAIQPGEILTLRPDPNAVVPVPGT